MAVAVRVEGLSKCYRIGRSLGSRAAYRTLRDDLVELAAAPWRWLRGGAAGAAEDFWALRDVNFEVRHGEVLGIIGRNGAGKSTLLKIVSRITRPTEGRVRLRGRVGSLLEVGTGFHPELTGRENIYLSAAVLGMSRAQVRGKFDEIVDFAEVEKFLDTPVKRYSSGMYVRLAFAVAAHLEPEVMIVDEVLAVGDAGFQKKCLGKVSDAGREGRTVVFVSHNLLAVRGLCRRVLRLEAGRVADDGAAGAVIARYCEQDGGTATERTWDDPAAAPAGEGVRLRSVRLDAAAATEQGGPLTLDMPLEVRVDFWNSTPGRELNVSLQLFTAEEALVLTTFSAPRPLPAGLWRATCRIPGNLLNDGLYRLGLLIVRDCGVPLVEVRHVFSFEMRERERGVNWFGTWAGAVRPLLSWDVRAVPDQGVPALPTGVAGAGGEG
jgi:lipopolysaccharide transport system ATP-binding protein